MHVLLFDIALKLNTAHAKHGILCKALPDTVSSAGQPKNTKSKFGQHHHVLLWHALRRVLSHMQYEVPDVIEVYEYMLRVWFSADVSHS